MKLVGADRMRAIDRETIENRGIPGPELMENAGRGIAEKIRDQILDNPKGKKIAVFCGKGNNGGDGFVVGRYLHQWGADISFYFPSPPEKLSEDARLNFNRAAELGINLMAVERIGQLPDFMEADYLIDSIFGNGFSGAPRGLLSEFIDYLNHQDIPVISIDCPSGLDIDTGQHEGPVVNADYTYTLALPKPGLYYSPGRELSGIVELVPIGIPDEVVDSFAITENVITPELISSLLPQRKPDGHKGDFGRLFILAGSAGMTGAAALAANGSIRSGLGLVTVGTPRSLNSILEIKLTEAMTFPLPDVGKKGALAKRGLGEIRKKIIENDAVIIGPGIGRHFETRELIQKLVGSLEKRAVIDADGLNAFEKDRTALESEHAKFVLTPHPGEFMRLIDEGLPDEPSARYDLIRRYAKKYNSVIVYKSSPTVVVDPGGGGQLFLNPTGNNGMATGGTGDVLSGIIGSFLAQGVSPLGSAIIGVYIHGIAGDIAAAEYGERSMIAGDLIDFLPDAFGLIESYGE